MLAVETPNAAPKAHALDPTREPELTSGYIYPVNHPPGWALAPEPPARPNPLPDLVVDGRRVPQIATSDEGCACWADEGDLFDPAGLPRDKKKARLVERAERDATRRWSSRDQDGKPRQWA